MTTSGCRASQSRSLALRISSRMSSAPCQFGKTQNKNIAKPRCRGTKRHPVLSHSIARNQLRAVDMATRFNKAWLLLKQTASEWSEDKVPQLGAALAFYTALSIAPLLVISLGVAATFFGGEAARGEVQNQMQ